MAENQFIEIDAPHLGVTEDEFSELVNDGIYGKALAEYLQSRLSQFGYDVPWVVCEDWGWYVPAVTDGFQLDVCVYGLPRQEDTAASAIDGQHGEPHGEPAGTPLSLCVQVGTPPGKRWDWRRFRRVDRTASVEKLHRDLLAVFQSDSEIKVIRCVDEFPLG